MLALNALLFDTRMHNDCVGLKFMDYTWWELTDGLADEEKVASKHLLLLSQSPFKTDVCGNKILALLLRYLRRSDYRGS